MIPGNDDAIRSIRLFVSAIADAALAGRAEGQGDVSPDEFVEVAEEEAAAAAPAAEEAAAEAAPAADKAPAAEEAAEEPAAKDAEAAPEAKSE